VNGWLIVAGAWAHGMSTVDSSAPPVKVTSPVQVAVAVFWSSKAYVSARGPLKV
jgi:hypothetical protein